VNPGPEIDTAGRPIVVWSWRGTVLFSVTAVAATVFDQLRWLAAAVALTLFGVGCVVFLVAFALAVERSRTEAIGIGGLYFLAGSAPRSTQRHLLGSLAVQVVVGLATAAIRMFTSLAFGTLVPVFGLAMAGLWGARYGAFEPRG
jgi:hypothetical protein